MKFNLNEQLSEKKTRLDFLFIAIMHRYLAGKQCISVYHQNDLFITLVCISENPYEQVTKVKIENGKYS